jgi:hypothetical protein
MSEENYSSKWILIKLLFLVEIASLKFDSATSDKRKGFPIGWQKANPFHFLKLEVLGTQKSSHKNKKAQQKASAKSSQVCFSA